MKKLLLLLLVSLFLTSCAPSDQSSEENEWTLFSDEAFGFSFEYPSDWIVESFSNGGTYVLITSLERKEASLEAEGDQMLLIDAAMRVYDSIIELPNNEGELSLDEWIEMDNPYFSGTPSTERVSISGVSAYQITSADPFTGKEIETLLFEYNDNIYQLNFDVPGDGDFPEERAHMQESFTLL